VTIIALGVARIYRKKFAETGFLALSLTIFALLFSVILGSSNQALYNSHVIFTSENNNLIYRYVYQYSKEMSYQTLLNTILRMFWLFYRILLPLVVFGFWYLRKNFILTVITLWLLIGTFSSLIFAGTGIIVWERWLIMLAFPFAVYAVSGAFRLGEYFVQVRQWSRPFKALLAVSAVVFWLIFIGLLVCQVYPFLTRSYQDAKPPLADDQLNTYFPRTMVHNSVGLSKINNLLEVTKWLNDNVPSGAAVIVDNRWRGLMLTHFNMDDRYIITNAWSQEWPRNTFEFAVTQKGFTKVYLIWDNNQNIRYFNKVFNSGYTAVYESKPLGQN
jgi:hypothetical protein